MRIGIIDDERPARSELKHQLLEILSKAEIYEGDSGAAALALAEREAIDILFLDINLGDLTGTVLVNAIKKMQPGIQVVFVTAYSEYAIQAFELGVEDYILKPFSKKRLEQVLDRLKYRKGQERETLNQASNQFSNHFSNQEKKQESPRRIAINIGTKTIFEDVENIVYIETYNRGCMVYTTSNTYSDSRTIGEYEKKLENGHFFRIHKSYLINIDKVSEVFPWGNNSFNLRMHGYEKNMLPVSRDKMKTLRHLLET